MKKKTVVFKKLPFDKQTIASLSPDAQNGVQGGDLRTQVGNTGFCGMCNPTQQVSCIQCVSTNTACGQTEAAGCVATGGMVTVCNIC